MDANELWDKAVDSATYLMDLREYGKMTFGVQLNFDELLLLDEQIIIKFGRRLTKSELSSRKGFT
jgi:hypothetical protein